MERIPQSTSLRVTLKAYLSSDHISPATGKTIAIVISKNAAAFGNPNAGATNATEIANGWYYVDLDSTDTGTLGPLLVRGTASGVDDVEPEGFRVVDDRVKIRSQVQKNTALNNFEFKMLSTSGNPTASLSVTSTRSIDGGSYAATTNSVTEVGNGTYKINLSAADLNGDVIGLRFTASGARDLDVFFLPLP